MKPVLLLIPGMLNDADIWTDVIAQLADTVDIRLADVSNGDDIRAMAAQAWRELEDLEADRPVLLAGFSMGGYVAIDMLAQPARPVRAAALIATSGRPDTPEQQAARDKSVQAFQQNFSKAIQGIAQWGVERKDPDTTRRLLDMMQRVGPDTACRQVRAIAQRADHREALRQLALPVAVVVGLDDRITPPALSQELASLMPTAQLHQIETCGHMVPIEHPEALARCLRSLLH